MINFHKSPTKKRQNLATGFTLIELLTVILIIGILTAIAIPSMQTFFDGASKKKTLTAHRAIIHALEKFNIDNGTYPYSGMNLGNDYRYQKTGTYDINHADNTPSTNGGGVFLYLVLSDPDSFTSTALPDRTPYLPANTGSGIAHSEKISDGTTITYLVDGWNKPFYYIAEDSDGDGVVEGAFNTQYDLWSNGCDTTSKYFTVNGLATKPPTKTGNPRAITNW